MNFSRDFNESRYTTFSVKDADICAEAVWPQGDISKTSVGLVFWAQDTANYFLLQVRGDGTTAIWRVQSNKWIVISNYTPASSVKQAAGDTNVLRAKVKGNLVSFFVNNVKIRDIRGQAPQPDWQFGLFGENQDKEKEIEVRFKHVKVTDAQ